MFYSSNILFPLLFRCFKEDNYDHSALDELKTNLSKAKEFPTTSKMSALYSFIAVSITINECVELLTNGLDLFTSRYLS
jgi:hypothetical protein